MRSPKPWYRKQRDQWCVTLDGRRIVLAQGKDNKKEAMKVFHQLMAQERPQPLTPNVQVASVLDLFLEYAQRHTKPETYEWYRRFLQDFCDHHGALLVRDLKPLHVTRWVDAHPGWKSSAWHAITAVKRAFNWAVEQELLLSNPVQKVKKPPMQRRTRYLTREERNQILDSFPEQDPFRQLLFALEETGCRPGEVSRVTSSEVDLDDGVWRFRQHKTAAKTGEDRIVVLTPAMIELTRQLMSRVPRGTPLFRNLQGEPWTSNAIRCRFRRLRERLGLGEDVVAYLYRHAACTDLLETGAGVAQTAELLGHTDTKMVMRHYSKLRERREHLREQLKKARDAKEG